MKDFEKDLIYGETVYVRVDAFNENGITEGSVRVDAFLEEPHACTSEEKNQSLE